MIFRHIAFAALLGLCGSAQASDDGPIDSVVNIDVMPTDQAIGTTALMDYMNQVVRDPTVLSSKLLQQTAAANHFILEETFQSRSAYKSHVETPYVRSFRAALFPHLGSPWDERLGRAIAGSMSRTHANAR